VRRHQVGLPPALPPLSCTSSFPRARPFPALEAPGLPSDLPRADVRAFSIDDAHTTEIDDALSVVKLPGIGSRIGIHIAAPGLAIEHGSPLDGVARARLSTVYMPGNKITMLPDAVVRTTRWPAASIARRCRCT
jgi:exoribonuclease II